MPGGCQGAWSRECAVQGEEVVGRVVLSLPSRDGR